MKNKKDDIIQDIIDLRLKKMYSTKSILKDYLMGELGYKQTQAYQLLKEAREKIAEYYKEENGRSIEEAIGQLEDMAQAATKNYNYKLAFEIRKELSKLEGHYIDKVEISGTLNTNISVIKTIEVLRQDDTKG